MSLSILKIAMTQEQVLQSAFPVSGIYVIEHTASGKKYVGQSIDIKRRWSDHVKHSQTRDYYFCRALRKHPSSEWKWFVISVSNNQEFLDFSETEAISHFDSTNPQKGYNCAPGAVSSPSKHPFVREKIRQKLFGKKRGPISEETKRKIGAANRGRKASPELRKKLSDAHKGQKVRPVTEEMKTVLRAKALERLKQPKYQEQLRNAAKLSQEKRKLNPIKRKGVPSPLKGKKQNPELVAKRVASMQKYWEAKRNAKKESKNASLS
jgi:group I intron endonuclease